MNEYTNIGKIDIKKIGKYKKKIITTELILTQERLNHHIYKYHEKEYIEIKNYIKYIIDNPDYILEDNKNIDTLIYLKHIEEINKKARVVIKLATNKNDKISIITIMRQRDKSWEQTLKNRGTIIYKKLDKDE